LQTGIGCPGRSAIFFLFNHLIGQEMENATLRLPLHPVRTRICRAAADGTLQRPYRLPDLRRYRRARNLRAATEYHARRNQQRPSNERAQCTSTTKCPETPLQLELLAQHECIAADAEAGQRRTTAVDARSLIDKFFSQ
jgi:hypothetical protein